MELLIFYFSVEHGGMGTLIVDIVMVGLFSIFFNQSLEDSIHETEIKPPGSKWSGPGLPRVEIGSK